MQPVPPSVWCPHVFSKEVPRTSKPQLRHPKQAEMYLRSVRPWAPYGFDTEFTNQCQLCGMPIDQWVIPEHLLPKPPEAPQPQKKKRWWQLLGKKWTS